jgi:site-specific DNA recombinase
MPTQVPNILSRSPMEILAEPTAVIYLRVSSRAQLTGHNPEGYSIEGQRAACERHAERLGARIIAEYVEPGKTATNARRPKLQEMLAALPELRPSYVIFYDLSRSARDEFDAFWLLREVESCGAKLESTLEHISDDEDGMLVYTIHAGINAHRSRRDGRKVRMGVERKFLDGGAHGPARTGYLNARELIIGREVAIITIDPDRAPHIKLGFDLAATGEHTLTTITAILEDVGLRTRPTTTRPSKSLSRSMVHRILRDDFYTGVVTLNGVKRQGRHPALIDRKTFERVQQVLDANRASGDRSHKHSHHLIGSLHCGLCERRLGYNRTRGNGGVYEYFACLSRVIPASRCGAPHFRVHEIEHRIEHKYKTLLLSPAEQGTIRQLLLERAEANTVVARREAERHRRRVRELTDRQHKLVELYYESGVSKEILQEQQTRLTNEQTAAEQLAAAADFQISEVEQNIADALLLIDQCRAPYIGGTPTEKRLINLAVYTMLLVSAEGNVHAKPTTFYAQLVPTARQLAREAAQDGHSVQNPGSRRQNGRSPVFRGHGLKKQQMAERAGFEPAMEFDPHTRLAGECLQPLGHLSRGWHGSLEPRERAASATSNAARPSRLSQAQGSSVVVHGVSALACEIGTYFREPSNHGP